MAQIEFLVVAIMVSLNAVFAGYEIALASVSVARLQALVEQKRRGAAAALAMKQEIEKSLAVVQLGITLVGVIAGATGGASAAEDIAPQLQLWGLDELTADLAAVVLVVAPLTAVTIVIGELVPKLFALRHKEWVCLTLSPLMKFFTIAVWPAVWFLEWAASSAMTWIERIWRPRVPADIRAEAAELQELRAIASLARTSRLIGSREENIILGAARLSARPIGEIALPAEHIRMLVLDQTLSESLIAAHLDLHTRFPVAENADDPQSIVGYVTFKDIVAAMKLNPLAPSIRGIVRDIQEFPSTTTISAALEQLLKLHTHIALVRDDRQGVVGMITLEDIVEELIGDIQDEHDLLPLHVIRAGDGWIVGGGATLERIREFTPFRLTQAGSAHNLSGWMIERLGRAPHGSDVIFDGDVRILVRKTRRERVLEAYLQLAKPADKPCADDAMEKTTHE